MVSAVRDAMAGGRLTVLLKPVGDACNLACGHCFYRGCGPRGEGAPARLPEAVLEKLLAGALRPGGPAVVELAWQGGEPLLAGRALVRRALELGRRLQPRGVRLFHTFQTNGVLLDDAWCDLLGGHDCLVGISLDGPAALHDPLRSDAGGSGSHESAVRAVRRLQAAGVAVNALVAVHARNQDHPLTVYRHVVDELGLAHLQLVPVTRAPAGFAVEPDAFGHFLVAVLGEWRRRHVGRVFVQQIEAVAARLLGLPAPYCVWAATCGDAPVVERTGDVYPCDHFVAPQHRLGNLLETPLAELVRGPVQRRFGLAKRDRLAAECRDCELASLCGGGCPKDRPAGTAAPRPSILCAAYRRFFAAALPALSELMEVA